MRVNVCKSNRLHWSNTVGFIPHRGKQCSDVVCPVITRRLRQILDGAIARLTPEERQAFEADTAAMGERLRQARSRRTAAVAWSRDEGPDAWEMEVESPLRRPAA